MPAEEVERWPEKIKSFINCSEKKEKMLNKLYRKFGADASSSARQARLVAAYEKRKKMEVTGAMALSEPMRRTTCKQTTQHWHM